MVLESEHCENSEINSTVGDVSIMKEQQSPFTYKIQLSREQQQCCARVVIK